MALFKLFFCVFLLIGKKMQAADQTLQEAYRQKRSSNLHATDADEDFNRQKASALFVAGFFPTASFHSTLSRSLPQKN